MTLKIKEDSAKWKDAKDVRDTGNEIDLDQSFMSVLLTLYSHLRLKFYQCHFFSLEDPHSFASLAPQHLSDLSKNHFHKAGFRDFDTAQVSLLCGHIEFCAFLSWHVSQLWYNI